MRREVAIVTAGIGSSGEETRITTLACQNCEQILEARTKVPTLSVLAKVAGKEGA